LIGKRHQYQELQARQQQSSLERAQVLEPLRRRCLALRAQTHHRRLRGEASRARAGALPASILVDLFLLLVENNESSVERHVRRWMRCLPKQAAASPSSDDGGSNKKEKEEEAEVKKWQRIAHGYRDFLALHTAGSSDPMVESTGKVEMHE
jgi:hypothetical protein